MLSQLDKQVCNLLFLSSHPVLFCFVSFSSTPTSMLRCHLYYRSAGNLYIWKSRFFILHIWNKTFIITTVWSLLLLCYILAPNVGPQCCICGMNIEEESSMVGEPTCWVKFNCLASGNHEESQPTGLPFC